MDPGYIVWRISKSADDREGRCDICGAHFREARNGWEPPGCTGECGWHHADPDEARDAIRDEGRR